MLKEKLSLTGKCKKKGGNMWKKILSFTVLCIFICSNAGFAMPASLRADTQPAAMIKQIVDNIAAYESFRNGSVSPEALLKFIAVAEAQLRAAKVSEEDINGMKGMWTAVLNKDTRTIELLAKGQVKLSYRVTEEGAIELKDSKGKTVLFGAKKTDAANDEEVVTGATMAELSKKGFVNIFEGPSGEAESDEAMARLQDKAIAAENRIALADSVKEGYFNELESKLNAAASSGFFDKAKKAGLGETVTPEQIIAAGKAKGVELVRMVVEDRNNWVAGLSKDNTIFLANELSTTGRVNQLFHEILEGMGYADKDIMQIQGTLLEETASTTKELKARRDDLLPKKDDLAPSTYIVKSPERRALESGLEAKKRLESNNAQEGDRELQNKGITAAEGIVERLEPADRAQFDSASPGQKLSVLADLTSKAAEEAEQKIPAAKAVFFSFTQGKQAEATADMVKQIASLSGTGDKVAMHRDDVTDFDAATGTKVLKASVVEMIHDLSLAGTLKAGALNFIGLGADYEDVKKQLELLGLDNVVSLNVGNESTVSLDEEQGQKVRVIYSEAVSEKIEGNVKNVIYIKVDGFNPQTNIMQVVINALQLSPEQIEGLMEGGVVSLGNVDMEFATYNELQDAFKTIKTLLIQA